MKTSYHKSAKRRKYLFKPTLFFLVILLIKFSSCESSHSKNSKNYELPERNNSDDSITKDPYVEPVDPKRNANTVVFDGDSSSEWDPIYGDETMERKGKVLHVSLKRKRSGIRLWPSNLKPDTYYKVSFDFKNETSDNQIYYSVHDDGDESREMVEINRFNYLANRKYAFYFSTTQSVTNIRLQFWNDRNSGQNKSFSISSFKIEEMPNGFALDQPMHEGQADGPWIYDRVRVSQRAPSQSKKNNWTQLEFYGGPYANMRMEGYLFKPYRTYEISYDFDLDGTSQKSFDWLLWQDQNGLIVNMPQNPFKQGRNSFTVKAPKNTALRINDIRLRYMGPGSAKCYMKNLEIRDLSKT